MPWAKREIAQCLFPRETGRDFVSFQVVSSWAAKETGFHVRHQLHKINSVAIGPILKGWREERHQIEPKPTLALG
jgi:hypothetical protein